jgi:drug/metabolite transporter (DMT)-like permease
VLALLAAIASFLCIGTVNFLGPLLTRRTPVMTVVAVGQGAAALTVALLLVVSRPALPGVEFLVIGGVAGAMTAFATAAAFRAGQFGNIGLVSVILALSAVIPAVGGVVEGERLPLHEWLGIAIAAAGTALTLLWGEGARSSSVPVAAAAAPQPQHPAVRAMHRASRSWLLLALGAAVGFGVFMLIFAELSEESILWAGLVSRGAMALSASAVILLMHQPMVAPGNVRRQLLPLPLLGLLMLAAIMLFGYASTEMLTVASALTAFAPVVTVSLSWLILHERLTHPQILGITTTILGLILLSI